MANKTVQLKDKANNDIFPLAGGMIADGITNAMLQNGSVTTSKIGDDSVTTAKIANASVDTANLVDSSVTAGKIDWSTIGHATSTTTSTVMANGTNWTDAGPSITFTVPGKYFFIGKASITGENSDWKHGLLRIYNSTQATEIGVIADSYGFRAADIAGLTTLTTFGIANVSANQTVKLQFKSPNSANGLKVDNENNAYPSLVCIRIGSAGV